MLTHNDTGYVFSGQPKTFVLELIALKSLMAQPLPFQIRSNAILDVQCYNPTTHRPEEPFESGTQFIKATVFREGQDDYATTFTINYDTRIYCDDVDGLGIDSLIPIAYIQRISHDTDDPRHIFEPFLTRTDCAACEIDFTDHSPPYVYEGRSYCLSCVTQRVERSRLAPCAGCGSDMSRHALQRHNGEEYCENCLRERIDICHCCNSSDDLDNMHRNVDGYPICDSCYSPEWETSRWNSPTTYKEIPCGITFGIELETSICPRYQTLEGKTKWGCVREASTAGKEFISPILYGDAGLNEIESFIGDNASSWEVNGDCGTHIHLSMRGWGLEEKGKVAFAFRELQGVFQALLRDRMANSMCGVCDWVIADLECSEDIEDFAMTTDKFNWLNIRPLLRQDTIEIRLLKGTLDPKLIRAWIVFCVKIMHFASSLTWDDLATKMKSPRSTIRSFMHNQFQDVESILQGRGVFSVS